jgi:hypothetical protein
VATSLPAQANNRSYFSCSLQKCSLSHHVTKRFQRRRCRRPCPTTPQFKIICKGEETLGWRSVSHFLFDYYFTLLSAIIDITFSMLTNAFPTKDRPRAPALKSTSITTIAGMVSDPSSSYPSYSRVNEVSTSPQTPYDPKDLLNPKSVKSSRNPKSPSPYLTTITSRSVPTAGGLDAKTEVGPGVYGKPVALREDGSRKAMLEGLYGVEHRTEQPRKRLKSNVEDNGVNMNKPAFTHRSNGIVGDYMKPDPATLPTMIDTLVDLTKGKAPQRNDDFS